MRDDEFLIDRDREVGDVVFDADGEPVPVLLRVEEVIDRLDVFGLGILGGEAITPADDGIEFPPDRGHGGDDIEIKRLAHRPGLFGPVEDGDLLNRRRDGFGKEFGRERTIEVDFD